LQLGSFDHRHELNLADSPSAGTSKRSIDDGEVLHSLPEHRAWVFGTTTLLATLFTKGAAEVHTLPGGLGVATAALLAYFVSGREKLLTLRLLRVHMNMLWHHAHLQLF
jgi:hypothetical protein